MFIFIPFLLPFKRREMRGIGKYKSLYSWKVVLPASLYGTEDLVRFIFKTSAWFRPGRSGPSPTFSLHELDRERRTLAFGASQMSASGSQSGRAELHFCRLLAETLLVFTATLLRFSSTFHVRLAYVTFVWCSYCRLRSSSWGQVTVCFLSSQTGKAEETKLHPRWRREERPERQRLLEHFLLFISIHFFSKLEGLFFFCVCVFLIQSLYNLSDLPESL